MLEEECIKCMSRKGVLVFLWQLMLEFQEAELSSVGTISWKI